MQRSKGDPRPTGWTSVKSPSRQRLFIRVTRATPDVDVFEGKFQVPEPWRSMTSKRNWDGRLRPPLPQHVLGADEAHFETHDRRPWKARVELPLGREPAWARCALVAGV